ncbi:LPXTG cell wall anchor domain-containing protein [Corynebacterium mustelae]|nr:LPXTG cell wall anchor domain-containing protein [Corynebacterium mustelae]
MIIAVFQTSIAPFVQATNIVTGPARLDCTHQPSTAILPEAIDLKVHLPKENPYDSQAQRNPRPLGGYAVRIQRFSDATLTDIEKLHNNYSVTTALAGPSSVFEETISTVTDADGVAQATGLVPGLYLLSVDAPAGIDETDTRDMQSAHLDEANDRQHVQHMRRIVDVEPQLVILPTISEECLWNDSVEVFVKPKVMAAPSSISFPDPLGENPANLESHPVPSISSPSSLARTGANSAIVVAIGLLVSIVGMVVLFTRKRTDPKDWR